MNKMMIKKVIVPAMALLLASCTYTQEKNTQALPEQEMAYKPSFIVLDVKDIVIIDRTENADSIKSIYKPSVDPKQAIINWAEKRLRAKGNKGKIEVIIKEASFKEEKLKDENGRVLESFKRGEHNKYDARYLVAMKLYSDDTGHNKISQIDIEASGTRNIEGIISSEDKNRIIVKMLQELLDNAEQQLEYNILTHFTENKKKN